MSENSPNRPDIQREMHKVINAANATDRQLIDNHNLEERINIEKQLRTDSKAGLITNYNVKDYLYHNVPMNILNGTIGEYGDMAYFFNKLYNVHGVGSAFKEPPLYKNHEIVTSKFINDIYLGRLRAEDAQKLLISHSKTLKQELKKTHLISEAVDTINNKLDHPLQNTEPIDASIMRSEMTISRGLPPIHPSKHIEAKINLSIGQKSEIEDDSDISAPNPLNKPVTKENTTNRSTIAGEEQNESTIKMMPKPNQSSELELSVTSIQNTRPKNMTKISNNNTSIKADTQSVFLVSKDVPVPQNSDVALPYTQSNENSTENGRKNTIIITTENLKSTGEDRPKSQTNKAGLPNVQSQVNSPYDNFKTNVIGDNRISIKNITNSTSEEQNNEVKTNPIPKSSEENLNLSNTENESQLGEIPHTTNEPTEITIQKVILPPRDEYSNNKDNQGTKISDGEFSIKHAAKSADLSQISVPTGCISPTTNSQLEIKPTENVLQMTKEVTESNMEYSSTRVPTENTALVETGTETTLLNTTMNTESLTIPKNTTKIKAKAPNESIKNVEGTAMSTTESRESNATTINNLKSTTLVRHNDIRQQNNGAEKSIKHQTKMVINSINNNQHQITLKNSSTMNPQTVDLDVNTNITTVSSTQPPKIRVKKRKTDNDMRKETKRRKESSITQKNTNVLNITKQQDNVLNCIKSSTMTIQSLLGNIHDSNRVGNFKREEEYDMDLVPSPDHLPMSSPPASSRNGLSDDEDNIINNSDAIDRLRQEDDDSDFYSHTIDNENERLPKALKRMNELAKKYGLYE